MVVDNAAAAAVYWVCIAAWLTGELLFMVRTSAGDPGGRDRSTLLLTLAMLGGLALAAAAAYDLEAATLPGGDLWPLVAGLVLLGAALAFRAWAMRTLGRFFKYTVVVQEGHRVVQSGPYRLVRHPSYTGIIAASFGAGLALGNWASVLAAGLPTLIGFSIRLLSEERTLKTALGEPYRDYMRRTWRLVPGIW